MLIIVGSATPARFFLLVYISIDERNIKNIKARIVKGKGMATKIITILDAIPFVKHYFKVGILLRKSQLVCNVLFNFEAHILEASYASPQRNTK